MKIKILIPFISLFCILQLFDSALCDTSIGEIKEKIIVDPHSLYYNRQQKKVVVPVDYGYGDGDTNAVELRYENAECYSYCKKDGPYEVFARRLINMILNNSRIKINNGVATGSVNLEATLEELDILRGFGNGKISIRELDGIIGDVIKKPEVNMFEEIFSYTDMLSFYIYERRRTFLSILCCIILIPIIVKGTRSKLGIITLFFTTITMISFVMTWQQLLQDAEIKLASQRSMYSQIPNECMRMELGFFSSFMLFLGIGEGDCLKYYETMMKDPMLDVTPTQAFIHMCTKSISYPILLFSEDFSLLINNIINLFPWYLQPIVKPLILIVTLLLIYGLIFIKVGGKFGIRIGPLFHFYIHGTDTVSAQNTISSSSERQSIEVIRSEVRDMEYIGEARNETNSGLEQNSEVSSTTQTAMISSVTSKSQKTAESPKTSEKSTQVDKAQKPEENDSNSDEFFEDNEYEKISKKIIESEMNRSRIEDVEVDIPEKDKKLQEVRSKNKKKSLETGRKYS